MEKIECRKQVTDLQLTLQSILIKESIILFILCYRYFQFNIIITFFVKNKVLWITIYALTSKISPKPSFLNFQIYMYISIAVRNKGANSSFKYLDLFEGNLKRKWLVIVRIQSALFNRSFLLLNSFPILHQRYLNIRIWQKVEVKNNAMKVLSKKVKSYCWKSDQNLITVIIKKGMHVIIKIHLW